jgi:hypothetical protein
MSLNDLIVIPKKTTYKVLMMIEQLQICQLAFTKEFIFENSIKRPHIGYFDFLLPNTLEKSLSKIKRVYA